MRERERAMRESMSGGEGEEEEEEEGEERTEEERRCARETKTPHLPSGKKRKK